jgi:SAM-dependent methyltransferase
MNAFPVRDTRSVEALRKARINPKELIAELSVEDLNHFSDLYYHRMQMPEFQMAKPYSIPDHAPKFFTKVGQILEGLDLGPTMRVLDFGAGTCWLSKMLWQLGCSVVSVEVSPKALEFGEKLMKDYPVPYPPVSAKWDGLVYDGRRFDLPDASIDRIVMFDVFHHVPNPEEVAAECFRVLRPGGVLAMNEPVGEHSSTQDSQHEMREFGVLENDLEVHSLAATFCAKGFSAPTFKVYPCPELEVSLSERAECLSGRPNERICGSIRDAMTNGAVLFFRKGERRLDSRRAEGLKHRLEVKPGLVRLKTREPQPVRLKLHNTGKSWWLADNCEDRGIVKVGTQLVDPKSGETVLDHGRWKLPRDVAPGESIEMEIQFAIASPGDYEVRFDLVSEFVCWFRLVGSSEVRIKAEVRD